MILVFAMAVIIFFACMVFLAGVFTLTLLERMFGKTDEFLLNMIRFLISLLAASVMAFFGLAISPMLIGWFSKFVS